MGIVLSDIETKNLDYNDEVQAKEIILRFKEEYLDNHIENLKDFSFWTIAGNPNFDKTCTPNSLKLFDGDHTRLAYAIDKLLYGDLKIPNFILNKTYKGDTINTFRTLFGNRFDSKGNGEIKIENEYNFTEDQKRKRNAFFYKYQTAGNFFVLPSETLLYGMKSQSINTFRGTVSNWKDYFDVFLAKLEICLNGAEVVDYDEVFLKKLLTKGGCNQEFFFNYCNRDLKKFLDIFFLDGYSTTIFPHESNKYYGHLGYSGDKETFKKFAFDYIDIATDLIDKRSNKILEKLDKKLKE